MNPSNVAEQLIIDEGLRLKPYYCPAGFLTIGVGRNLEGRGLSWSEMVTLIEDNPRRKEKFSNSYVTMKGESLMLALIKDFKSQGITTDEAFFLLHNDIRDCNFQLYEKLIWYPDAHPELQEVLVNMCFNLGIGTLMTFKNTLYYMSVGDYIKASENMLKSKWARQVGKRAKRLAERVRKLAED